MMVKKFVTWWLSAALVGLCAASSGAAPRMKPQPAAPVTKSGAQARAVSQFEAGHYTEAVAVLEQAVDESPDDAALYHWLSRCYLELGQTEAAVKNAERAVDRDSKRSEYHRWLGRAYGAEADRTRSFWTARRVKSEFEKAIDLQPSNIAARRDVLEFYLEAPWIVGGGRDKARDEARAIAALDPVEGALAEAACDAKDGKDEAAAAEYARALAMQPAEPDPYFEAAAFHAERGHASALLSVVASARAVAPADPRLDYYRGVAAAIGGDRLDAGEAALQAYLAQAPVRNSLPSHASAHLWLGRVYEQQGLLEAAADQYRIALKLNPDGHAAREALERVKRVL